jgi:hypothetical protein
LPDRLGVITAVAQCAIRSMARTPTHALQGRDGINQCEGSLPLFARAVGLGPSEAPKNRPDPQECFRPFHGLPEK